MKFGLFSSAQANSNDLPAESGQGFRDFLDFNVEAEALGFQSSFLVEHHFTGWNQVSATLMLLLAAAMRTTTLRLGSAVIVLPWHNPVVLAEQAAIAVIKAVAGTLTAGRGSAARSSIDPRLRSPSYGHSDCVRRAAGHYCDPCTGFPQRRSGSLTTRTRVPMVGTVCYSFRCHSVTVHVQLARIWVIFTVIDRPSRGEDVTESSFILDIIAAVTAVAANPASAGPAAVGPAPLRPTKRFRDGAS